MNLRKAEYDTGKNKRRKLEKKKAKEEMRLKYLAKVEQAGGREAYERKHKTSNIYTGHNYAPMGMDPIKPTNVRLH